MDIKQLREYLGEDLVKVEKLIRESLRSDIDLLNYTNDSILSHSGKQLRPILTLLMGRICSGGHVTVDTIGFAAATELLHNATLLHDDVADKSTVRRGRPTVMSILGGPASVLIGDFWLVKAMDNVLSSKLHSTDVIKIFARTLSDLAEGEMLQLQKAERGDTDENDYIRIIYNKTASLFVTAAESAAISVGASAEQQNAAKAFATALGIAFQIKDDIFDYSDSEEIGKPVGIDLLEQKITLPLLGALGNVDKDKQAEIRKMVSGMAEHPENVSIVRDFVKANGGVEYAEKKLDEYISKAIIALRVFPDSPDKECLKAMAQYVGIRQK
ncbi:MAG: polyprenyl synthetase family protein [Bacteroidales bacterium]|nr:polyprenyl synthetase family protein [Bacteroidales bacterium]